MWYFFLPWPNSPHLARVSPLLRLHDHTQAHNIQWDSSGQVISPSHRSLPNDTQHVQETNIHAPGGIRTKNPSKRAAADRHLRPRCHRDRLLWWIRNKLTVAYPRDKKERRRRLNCFGILSGVDWKTVTEISEECSIFVFRVKISEKGDCFWISWPLLLGQYVCSKRYNYLQI